MMAIYHLTTKSISRGSGGSATAASAYRSGEKVKDEQTGKLHDYSRRQGVIHSEIIAPNNAPEWTKNRSQLWNAVEASEKRKDSRVAREVEISLPRELDTEQNLGLVRDFVQTQFVDMGMVADVALHSGEAKDGGQNPHAHILLTTRNFNAEINPDDSPADAFGQKNRDWNSKEQLQEWRKNWQGYANNHLEQAGETERIDHRTLEAQGEQRKPTIHMGKEASALEKKGIESNRGNTQRKIEHYNGVMAYAQSAENLSPEEKLGLVEKTREYVGNWVDNARSAIIEKYAGFRERFEPDKGLDREPELNR